MRALTIGVVCALFAVGCGGDNNDTKLGGGGADAGNNGVADMGGETTGGGDDMGGTADTGGGGGEDAGTDMSGGGEDAGTDMGGSGEDAGTDMGGVDMGDNQPPVANAGLDQDIVYKNRNVNLQGEASSDPDGDALTYSWTQVSGTNVTLSDSNIASPQFTSPFTSGDLVFRLTVDDGLATSQDDVVVTVVNQTPDADAGIGQDAQQGALVTLDGSQSDDGDGESLTFAWSQVSGTTVTLSDTTSPTPTFTTPNDFGDLVFELAVSDGEDTATDRTTVSIINLPPVAEAGPDQNLEQGDLATLDGSGSFDPEGQTLTYMWTQVGGPSNVTLSDATAVSPTFATPVGTGGAFVFELVVNDGNSDSAVDRTRVTTPNNPPVADAGADGVANSGEIVFLNGRGSFDPDGDTFDYTWTQTAGTPVNFGSGDAARAYFKVPNGAAQTLSFDLTVTNSQGTSTDSVSFQTVPWNGTTVTLPANPFATTLRPFTNATWILDLVGDHLFVGGNEPLGGDDLAVYDVSTPETPVLLATADSGGAPGYGLFNGTIAYVLVANELSSWSFDDNAGTLTQLDTITLPSAANSAIEFREAGDTLFAALFNNQTANYVLAAFDIADPANMTLLHSESTGSLGSIDVRGNELWVGGLNELSVYDISSIRSATPAFTELTDDQDDHCPYATRAMQIVGDYLYAACDTNVDLAVFDISTPAEPDLLKTIDVAGVGMDLVIDQNTAYVAGGAGGVLMFDLTTPNDPTYLGALPTSQSASIARVGSAVFARVGGDEIDILEPSVKAPEFAASVPVGGTIWHLGIQNDLVATATSDVQLFDVADVSNVQPYATVPVSGRNGVVIDFPYVYASGNSAGLSIVDVQVPAQPVTLTTLLSNLSYGHISLDGTMLVAALGDDGVNLYDVSNQSSPQTLGNFSNGEDFRTALVEGTMLYTSTWGDGLYVVDITNPALPTELGFTGHTSPRGELDKSGDFVWNGFGNAAWYRFDVSTPATPTRTVMSSFGGIEQIRVNGAIGWLAQGPGGFATVDVSDPANPVVLERYSSLSTVKALVVGDDEVWIGDGDTLRGVRIDNAALTNRYETGAANAVLSYGVTWQEPVNDAEAKCFVTGGTCSVTGFDGTARTATVEWTLPGAAADHEIAVVVGHAATRAFLRDRVRVQ